MAKSLNIKQINNAVDDDMIKDALKTGLSSIKASDYLVNQTILKCQNEITKEKQKNRPKIIMPWIYKLGAPLAAGALVLVLLINTNGLRMKNNSASDIAPQASTGELTSLQGEEGPMSEPAPMPEAKEDQLYAAYGSSPEDMGDSTVPDTEKDIAKFTDGATLTARAKVLVLNSLANHAPNSQDEAISNQSLNAIASLYNETKGTQLILKEEGITRITSLVKTGVDAQKLEKAQDYHGILSEEGYWALPLMSDNGDIEMILAVNTFDSDNPNTTISSQDIIYSVGGVHYIVTEFTDSIYMGSELKELMDINAIGDIIKKSGYTYNSDIIVADVNYGMDFIALFSSGKQEFVIPFMINSSMFGLENRRVYTWTEFTQVVSQSMKQ